VPGFVEAVQCVELVPRQAGQGVVVPHWCWCTRVLVLRSVCAQGGRWSSLSCTVDCTAQPKHTTNVCRLGDGTEHWLGYGLMPCVRVGTAAGVGCGLVHVAVVLDFSLFGHRLEKV
jgi:hypothetical protein